MSRSKIISRSESAAKIALWVHNLIKAAPKLGYDIKRFNADRVIVTGAVIKIISDEFYPDDIKEFGIKYCQECLNAPEVTLVARTFAN